MNTQTKACSLSKADLFIVVGLAIAAVCVFIPFLGATGMFDPTDSFFIEASREMFRTHEFSVPLMNYEQWLDKPAFAFWLIILSYKIFAVNEFAGRLPSALSGIAVVLVTYLLSRPILSRRQALLSSLVLLASPLFVVVGHVALTDEPLCLLLTATLLCLANRIVTGSFPMLCLGFFTLSLGVLCKGPLALILVGLITIGYLLASRPKMLVTSILNLNPILAILIFAVLVVPYYVWAHVYTHGLFTQTFFLRQNLGRIAGNLNHIRPFWFYIPVLVMGLFPWSLLLIPGGKTILRLWTHRTSESTGRQQLLVFSLCWAVLGLILFSSVPTKLETYIVPILPALAIMAGCYMDVVLRARNARAIAVIAVAMLLACGLVPVAVIKLLHGSGTLAGLGCAAAVAMSLALLFAVVQTQNKKLALALGTICGVAWCACALFVPLFFHLYHGREQEDIDRLALYAKQRGANLAIVRYELPSLIYRFEHKIPEIQDEPAMRQFAEAADGPQWIFVHHDVLSLLSWTERSPRVVAYEGKWWLFAIGRNCRKENTVEWLGLDHGPYPTLTELLGH